jgi:hypothetical protein
MNKFLWFLISFLACIVFSGCGKSKKKIKYTDELELASVSVNRTFVMNDKEGKILWLIPYEKAGDRVAIYRMGACVFTAYINLEKINVSSDDDGNYTIKCPEIKIKGPDYVDFDKRTCKFKKIDYDEDRKDFEPEEINDEEKKAFKEIKKLKEDDDFIEKLKETAQKSANVKLKQFIAVSEGISTDNITIEF